MASKYTKEILEPIVQSSTTMTEVLGKIGISPRGGNNTYVKKIIDSYEISTEHFVGSSSNKGKSFPTLKPDQYLIYYHEGTTRSSHKIKLWILRDKVKPHQCEKCGLTEWNNLPIPLHLHHKDGDTNNYQLENVELLCANCHAQTDNYSGKAAKHEAEEKVERKQKVVRYCSACGKELFGHQKVYCSRLCSNKANVKEDISKPSKEQLVSDLSTMNITAIARKYGFSRAAVRRWITKFEI